MKVSRSLPWGMVRRSIQSGQTGVVKGEFRVQVAAASIIYKSIYATFSEKSLDCSGEML